MHTLYTLRNQKRFILKLINLFSLPLDCGLIAQCKLFGDENFHLLLNICHVGTVCLLSLESK